MIIAIQNHGRLALFANGVRAVAEHEGKRVHFVEPGTRGAAVTIFWGYRAALEAGLPQPFIVADKGWTRRPSVMFGRNEWGARAEWPEPAVRRAKIADWRHTESKTALLIGQEPGDFSTRSALKNGSYNAWRKKITDQLEKKGWEVAYREHPRNLIHAPMGVPRPPPIEQDFARAGLVVGLNSGALIEAAIYGLPVVALDDHSLVAAISTTVAQGDQGEPEGRRPLFDRLAGLEWTYPELESGAAWEALRGWMLGGPA